MSLLEYIFGGGILLWVSGLSAVLWNLASVPRRVKQLEDMMIEYFQKAEILAGLQATVQGQSDRIDRGQDRNIKEHDVMHGLLRDLTEHVLAIRESNGDGKMKVRGK